MMSLFFVIILILLLIALSSNLAFPQQNDGWLNARMRSHADEEVAQELRFQKQCYLAYNMQDILGKLGTPATIPRHYTAFRGASPAELTSKLTSQSNLEKLFTLKPYQLSYLVPQIKLYKVVYSDRENAEQNNGEEMEFKFDDIMSSRQIDNIMHSHSGRGGGVGLQSFAWEFLGVNPAEVENNIKARLKLFFNNIADFEEPRAAGMPLPRASAGGTGMYRFSDLIVPEPLYLRNPTQVGFRSDMRRFNPNFFRIKVVAGWSVPNLGPGNDGPEWADWEEIQELLRLNKKVMYLNLISHDINFNEDGSMELSAEYQAYAEGIFSSQEANVLAITEHPFTPSIEEEIERQQAGNRISQNILNGNCDNAQIVVTNPSGLLTRSETEDYDERIHRERLEEDMEVRSREESRARHRLNRYRRYDRARTYSRILGNVINSGKVWRVAVDMEEDLQARIHRTSALEGWKEVIVPAEATGSMQERYGTGAVDEESPLRELLARRRFARPRIRQLDPIIKLSDSAQPGSFWAGDDPWIRRLYNVSGPENIGSGDFSQDDYEATIEQLRRQVSGQRVDVIPIDFVFFGDLLDAIIQPGDTGGISTYLFENNIQIYLGTFPYNDPYDPAAEGEPVKHLPIAEIPISLEMFGMWFLEEIIEPQRTRISLSQFIKLMFDKLVSGVFGSQCVLDPEGNFALSQENLVIIPEIYTIPDEKLQQLRENQSSTPDSTFSVSSTGQLPWINIQRLPFGLNLHDYDPAINSRGYVNFVLYQAQDLDPNFIIKKDITNYAAAVAEDFEQGIYHLNIGSDHGLVKNIKFSRMDQKGLREARIEAAGELGSFDQLRERYNATITLYGNMFFYPGQHVFINPSMVGMNAVQNIESLTTKLGLGGYFLILKVENIVEMGNFETILTCSWTHTGFPAQETDGNEGPCRASYEDDPTHIPHERLRNVRQHGRSGWYMDTD